MRVGVGLGWLWGSGGAEGEGRAAAATLPTTGSARSTRWSSGPLPTSAALTVSSVACASRRIWRVLLKLQVHLVRRDRSEDDNLHRVEPLLHFQRKPRSAAVACWRADKEPLKVFHRVLGSWEGVFHGVTLF